MHLHNRFTFRTSAFNVTYLMAKCGYDRWRCFTKNKYPKSPGRIYSGDDILDVFKRCKWVDYQEFSDKWDKRVERMNATS